MEKVWENENYSARNYQNLSLQEVAGVVKSHNGKSMYDEKLRMCETTAELEQKSLISEWAREQCFSKAERYWNNTINHRKE